MWRALPGRAPLKLLCSLVLLVAALAVLFLVVFPLVDQHLPTAQVTVRH